MSNKPVKGSDGPSWGYGYVISDRVPDQINGLIFEIVEAIGLPAKQEDSVKSLVRKSVWKAFEDSVYISSERHSEIRLEEIKKREDSRGRNLPMSAV